MKIQNNLFNCYGSPYNKYYNYASKHFNNSKPLNILQNNKNMDYNKIHIISFASTNSNFSKERFYDEAALFGFKSIKIYTEKDFSEGYLTLYKDHFNDKRGYGYWSWKSYIIKEHLKLLADGEYLIYADCGCTINKDNKSIFENIWMTLLENSAADILCPCLMDYLEMEWNKIECVNYINKRYNAYFDINSKLLKQHAATVIIIKKSDISKHIVNEWFDICNNHYELITDKLSENENPNLKEHRHDQSVFSLLCYIYNVLSIYSNNGIDDKQHAPIYASKIKNDKQTYLSKQINRNVDIFICTHKDFDAPYNHVYKIISGKGQLQNKYPLLTYEDNLLENQLIFNKEYGYTEWSRISYIKENVTLKDYIGIVHYRKYFNFNSNPEILPDFSTIFNNYDIILLDSLFSRLLKDYKNNHFISHWLTCVEIGKYIFPEYTKEFDMASNSKTDIYYCNMFIMKKNDFYNMCNFVLTILTSFDKKMNFNTDDDIHKWVESHINECLGKKDINYQSRVEGFLSERLFTIWIFT